MPSRPRKQRQVQFPFSTGVALCALVLSLGGFSGVHAGEGRGVSSLAEKEISKRQAQVTEAEKLMTEAASLSAAGDDEGAMKLYRQAWDLLPDAPATAALRTAAKDGYSRSAVAHARKLAKQGRYADAKTALESVLEEDFNPTYADAKVLLKQLGDPDRYEPALTPKHVEDVASVEKLLRLGNGLISLGDYDGAIEKFQAVLRIDRYNVAARKGLENAEHKRDEYFGAARDHKRAKAIAEVDKLWEDNVPAATDVSSMFSGGSVMTSAGSLGGKDAILTKLRAGVVPIVDLQGATLDEVVEFLRIRSRDLDPKHQGISFVLRVPEETKTKNITLSLTQVPLEEVLRYVTQMSGTAYRVDEFAVTITSLTERTTNIVTRQYRVPPDFINNAPVEAGAAPNLGPGNAPPNPFGGAATTKGAAPVQIGGLTLHRLGAREFLEQRGISFPEGASASYNPATNILLVRNTVENLAAIDDLVEQASSATPKQVEVKIRIVKVSETRLNELGFDWMVGAFNLPGSNGLFGAGGTVGNQRGGSFTGEDFPVVSPGGTPVGTNPITAGLRSSGAILGVPSIDGLIQGANQIATDSRSPGQFALAGVFTDPQFQMVIRTLSQTKGVDLLASPSVVTKSGQRASVVVSREFIYPTQFNPPQIPQNLSATVNGTVYLANFAPVTPTTPTAFAKRDVGIVLEVEPVISGNNRQIDLNLTPSSTDFEGFIDYGSPIRNSAPIGLGGSRVFYNQPNPVIQPIFGSNKATSSVSIWDGQTVAIAGVISEKRTQINDKVPIVGDLPLVGRAFQSKVTQSERQNVIIYVTARVLDPSGRTVAQPAATTAGVP